MKKTKKGKFIKLLAAVAVAVFATGLCACGKKTPPSPAPPPCAHINVSERVVTAATCLDTGVSDFVCDDCGVTVRTEVTPALGHDYSNAERNGRCRRCNTKICTPGLSYEKSPDGTYYTVMPMAGLQESDLVIPEYHDSLPVREIANEAFTENEFIKSVSIPSTITKIGMGAFSLVDVQKLYFNASSCEDFFPRNNTFLLAASSEGIELTIGRAVERIPGRMFYPFVVDPDNTVKLKSIAFEDKCEVEEIGEYAFYKLNLDEIVLPDSVKRIGDHAFINSKLESVTFGAGLEQIGSNCFNGSSLLEQADLSRSAVSKIGAHAFYDCAALTCVKLSATPCEIGESAFEDCVLLDTLDLNGAESIGDRAFYGCSALSALTVTEGVKSIGNGAFGACEGLARIDYKAKAALDLGHGNLAFTGSGTAELVVSVGGGVTRIPARLFFSSVDPDGNLAVKTLYISSDVAEIGDYAFTGITAQTVLYGGSSAQLAAIDMGVGNDIISGAQCGAEAV